MTAEEVGAQWDSWTARMMKGLGRNPDGSPIRKKEDPMAGNKKVPLTWGIGGPIIGTASIDENGLIIAEIDSGVEGPWRMETVANISIFSDPADTVEDIEIEEQYLGGETVSFHDLRLPEDPSP